MSVEQFTSACIEAGEEVVLRVASKHGDREWRCRVISGDEKLLRVSLEAGQDFQSTPGEGSRTELVVRRDPVCWTTVGEIRTVEGTITEKTVSVASPDPWRMLVKRDTKRASLDCELTVVVPDPARPNEVLALHGRMLDLSVSGCGFVLNRSLAEGTMLSLRFRLPRDERQLSPLAQVVYAVPARGPVGTAEIGARFVRMDSQTQGVIRAWTEQSKREAVKLLPGERAQVRTKSGRPSAEPFDCSVVSHDEEALWLRLLGTVSAGNRPSRGSEVNLTVLDGHIAKSLDTVVTKVQFTRLGVAFAVQPGREWVIKMQRPTLRVATNITAEVVRVDPTTSKTERPITATIQDISVTGARMRSRVLFKQGDLLVITFKLGERQAPHTLLGNVVRAVMKRADTFRGYSVGVKFMKMSDTTDAALREYVDRKGELMQQERQKEVEERADEQQLMTRGAGEQGAKPAEPTPPAPDQEPTEELQKAS
jgi:hypothetical protein